MVIIVIVTVIVTVIMTVIVTVMVIIMVIINNDLPIMEFVLFGRAWWMSYLTSSHDSDCKILVLTIVNDFTVIVIVIARMIVMIENLSRM